MKKEQKELSVLVDRVRERTPLIHNITNYVTVNDCANILLACGGSPIMSDELQEVEEITSICGGLHINIGTLNQRTIPAMKAAGKKANACGHLVLLDPVGAGASRLRTETAEELLKEVKFTAIRGNISEIKTLALGMGDDQRSGCGQYGRGDGCHAGGGSHICRRICPKDRGRGSDYRCGGYCDGRQGGFCHKQRPSHDEQGNRYRLYAVRHDDGLSYGKS